MTVQLPAKCVVICASWYVTSQALYCFQQLVQALNTENITSPHCIVRGSIGKYRSQRARSVNVSISRRHYVCMYKLIWLAIKSPVCTDSFYPCMKWYVKNGDERFVLNSWRPQWQSVLSYASGQHEWTYLRFRWNSNKFGGLRAHPTG